MRNKLPCGREKAESDCYAYCSKSVDRCRLQTKRLDIDLLPEELYVLLQEEFEKQYGKSIYGDWDITATKMEGE